MDEAKSNKKCLSDHTDSDDLIARKIRAATVFSRNFATQFFFSCILQNQDVTY
jgi:hypothetical protein